MKGSSRLIIHDHRIKIIMPTFYSHPRSKEFGFIKTIGPSFAVQVVLTSNEEKYAQNRENMPLQICTSFLCP